MIEVSTADWKVVNRTTGCTLKAKPVPEMLLSLMAGGGIFPVLEQRGLIAHA